MLGVVEGLTEFLPVSSTAHLRITQYFLGVPLDNEFWKLFAIFIQLGAIFSVVLFYYQRLKNLTISFLKSPDYRHPVATVTMAFIVTAILALLSIKMIGDNLESLKVMVMSLIVGGVIMIVVDHYFAKRGHVTTLEQVKPYQALFIGLAQVLAAIFPGTSRSMSTIAGGQIVGLSRSTALEFSFFVSIPVIAVATVYDLLKYVKGGAEALTLHQMMVLACGFVVSFIVAYMAIAWFLAFVRAKGFFWFGIYRIVFGLGLFFMSGADL